MNKLKEINGKFYQECEVVMLATDKQSQRGLVICKDEEEILHLYRADKFENKDLIVQNIYFLSNEEIKDERILYCNLEKQIIDYRGQLASPKSILGHSYMRYCKKIIATTDLLLNINNYSDVDRLIDFEYNLPQPSQSFIQAFIRAYNEGKIITKVLVEMDNSKQIYCNVCNDILVYNNRQWKCIRCKSVTNNVSEFKLKVTSSNEITIKKIKDSWTREEVVALCKSAYKTGTKVNDIDYFEWENRNL